MASNIPTDLLGVRDTLKTKYNIADENIGWNPNTNMVTLYGKDTIRPTSNVDGTAYAGQDVFNSAAGSINALKQQNDLMTQYTNPQQQVNPYDNQVASIISQLQGMAAAAPQDVYSTPQFAAAQAQAQRGAQQATRQAQESLGSSGFGRSTRLMDRTQGIQNDANNYLNTQLVPQIQAQLQAEQQAKMANLANILNALGSQQQLYDTRQQTQRSNLAGIVDFLTGRSDRTEDKAYQTGRDAITDQRYDAEVEYKKARDLITDEKDKTLFDEDVRRYGLDYALKQQAQELDEKQVNANIANNASDNARSAEGQRVSQLMDIWRNTGVAPEGIPGVPAGTKLADANNSQIANLKEEKQGLVDALRSGSITPASAFKQIQEDLGFGFYTAQDAQELQSVVQSFSQNTPQPANTTETLTKEQQDAMPSENQLDKLYKDQGKPINAPELDWKSWYKDPLGRVSGTDFATWQKLYGPQLKAK